SGADPMESAHDPGRPFRLACRQQHAAVCEERTGSLAQALTTVILSARVETERSECAATHATHRTGQKEKQASRLKFRGRPVSRGDGRSQLPWNGEGPHPDRSLLARP